MGLHTSGVFQIAIYIVFFLGLFYLLGIARKDVEGFQSTCTPGYYPYSVGPGVSLCFPCEAGTECPTGREQPVVCRPGSYSLGQARSCSPCPIDTYSESAGASACTPCPTGTYASVGAVSCTRGACLPGYACHTDKDPEICLPGTYSNRALVCTPCPPGTHAANPGASSCTACPRGTFCDTGYSSPMVCGSTLV